MANRMFCLPACDAFDEPNLLLGCEPGTWPVDGTLTIPGGGDIYPGHVPVFFFEFIVSDSILDWPADGRPLSQDALPQPDLPTWTTFVVGRDELLGNPNLASQLLSAVGVPSVLHPPFVRTINSEAASLASETPDGIDPRVIPIVVRVVACRAGNEEEAIAMSMMGPDEDDELMAEATMSSSNDDNDDEILPEVVVTGSSLDDDTIEEAKIEGIKRLEKLSMQ